MRKKQDWAKTRCTFIDPDAVRQTRAATTAELLADLAEVPEHYHEVPYLVDELGADVSVVELVRFRVRLRSAKDAFNSDCRIECVVRNVDLPVMDNFALADKRARAECTPAQLNSLADMLEFYCEEPLEGESLLNGYKSIGTMQAVTPVITAARDILQDTDPDTGVVRNLTARGVREAAAIVLRAVVNPQFSAACTACADDLTADDGGDKVASVVERLEGLLDDLRG